VAGVGGGEEKGEKQKEGLGQEDQSAISYARKDSERGRHVVQLVSHAALDTIDALIWAEKSMSVSQSFHSLTSSPGYLVNISFLPRPYVIFARPSRS
jgi:hypothetical protein